MNKAQKRALGIGAGVAALAAAATAVYFTTGKNAKNRKKIATWAKQMQADVVKELNKVKKDSRAAYNQAVDEVARNYKAAKKVTGPELAALVTELKGHWDVIRGEMASAQKKVKRVTAKSSKRSWQKTFFRIEWCPWGWRILTGLLHFLIGKTSQSANS